MRDILTKLKEGKSVEVPIYDFNLHARVAETKRIYGATVIVFECIMAFCDEFLRDLMDVKGIFRFLKFFNFFKLLKFSK